MTIRLLIVLVGLFLCWINTGSLSPYAATSLQPIPSGPCNYLYSVDHPLFQATYLMLDGSPPIAWGKSVVLRRVLYPLIAYPFMHYAGFEFGGLIVNFLTFIVTTLIFTSWIAKKYDYATGIVAAVLISFNPGVAYWIGLPYSYALILPGALLSVMLISSLEACSEFRKVIGVCLLSGALGLIHDVLALFPMIAVSVLLLLNRQLLWSCLAAISIFAPLAAVHFLISELAETSTVNTNTIYYLEVLQSFFSQFSLAVFCKRLLVLPQEVLASFLFSQFLAFAILIVGAFGMVWINRRHFEYLNLSKLDVAWLLSFTIVFLVINLSPMESMPFSLRGSNYSRFYQSAFPPLLLWFLSVYFKAKNVSRGGMRSSLAAGVMCVAVFNVGVLLSAWTNPSFGGWIYHNFYGHSPPEIYARNIGLYGKHPVGSVGCPLLLPDVPYNIEYVRAIAEIKSAH